MDRENLILAPPQIVLFERLKHTIGEDPNVCINEMKCESEIFKIFIVVKCPKKAKALASILKRYYYLGCTNVEVIVIFDCKEVEPCCFEKISNKKEFVKKLFNSALNSNCFFNRAVIINHSKRPETLGDVAVIFNKRIVQFFADNIADFCGNINEVAEDAFSCILIDKFFCDVKVSFSTFSKCCL